MCCYLFILLISHQVSIPLGWFAQTTHDGFRFQGNSAGAVGWMYLDQIRLVSYLDTYSEPLRGIGRRGREEKLEEEKLEEEKLEEEKLGEVRRGEVRRGEV
jgi:hypothetical protein